MDDLMSVRLALTALLVFSAVLPLTFSRDREAARQAFEKAKQEYDLFLAQDESNRPRKQYDRLLFLLRRVVDHDPTYSAADDALYYTATLYEEMGRRFGNSDHTRRAVYYYRFVAREYPTTKYRKTAQARAEALTQAVRTVPVESEAAAATQAADDTSPPASSPGPPARKVEQVDGPTATVSSIRYWSNDDYTRVVVQLDREVPVRKEVLSSPDRLYLDLSHARLKSGLLARTYAVNDLFIKQVRVAENRPGVVRVVLDYENINTHTMFMLYDPFRVVIDTRGVKKPQTAQAERPRQKMQTAQATIPLDSSSAEKNEVRKEAPVLPSPSRQGDLSLTRVLGLKVGRVVIDPGHGGKDTGSIGPGGLREKDLVLDVASRLKSLLEERMGTEVVMTRTGDEFVPLEERTAIANQHRADLFVSIHANSSRSRRVSGAETFYLSFATSAEEREVASRENAGSQRNIHELENLLRQIALGDYHAESRQLAELVQTNLWSGLKPFRPNQANRGVKKAPFIVLIGANMPSILTEIGFISNAADEKYMQTEEARSTIAEALYRGVEEYFRTLGVSPIEQTAASH
jgi:N-acetylmuramoyl-L-alanine amidase